MRGLQGKDRKRNVLKKKIEGGGEMKIQVSGERVSSVREEMCKRCMCEKLVKDYWV